MPVGSSNNTGFGLDTSLTYRGCCTDAFSPATSFERNSNTIVHEQLSILKLLTNLSNWGQQQEHMKNRTFFTQIKNSYHLRQSSLNLTELFSLGLRTRMMQNIQKA